MSNLRLINETTVSSSVAKVKIENVFTSDYDIYKIVYDNFFADGQDLINLSFLTPQGSEERLYYAYGWAFLDVINWFMALENPNNAQAGLVSVVVGAGAGWFAIYVNGKATKIKNKD